MCLRPHPGWGPEGRAGLHPQSLVGRVSGGRRSGQAPGSPIPGSAWAWLPQRPGCLELMPTELPDSGRTKALLGRVWSPASGRLPPRGEAASRDRPRGLVVAWDPKPGRCARRPALHSPRRAARGCSGHFPGRHPSPRWAWRVCEPLRQSWGGAAEEVLGTCLRAGLLSGPSPGILAAPRGSECTQQCLPRGGPGPVLSHVSPGTPAPTSPGCTHTMAHGVCCAAGWGPLVHWCQGRRGATAGLAGPQEPAGRPGGGARALPSPMLLPTG